MMAIHLHVSRLFDQAQKHNCELCLGHAEFGATSGTGHELHTTYNTLRSLHNHLQSARANVTPITAALADYFAMLYH